MVFSFHGLAALASFTRILASTGWAVKQNVGKIAVSGDW
jgi:hypothetical protein